jgi:hypothetical protein
LVTDRDMEGPVQCQNVVASLDEFEVRGDVL